MLTAKRNTVEFISKFSTVVFSLLTLSVGLLAMFGLYTHYMIFFQPSPVYIAMVFNTALCFFLVGIVLLLQVNNRYQYGCAVLLFSIFILNVLSLSQHLFSIDFKIDQLIFNHYVNTKTSHPGRMAPNTSVGFIITMIALTMVSFRIPKNYYLVFTNYLGFIIFSVAAIFLSGYLFGIQPLYQWGKLTPIAPNTALGFVFLGISIFSLVWYRSQVDRVYIIGALPSIIFVGLMIGTVLYWHALDIYQIEQGVPTYLSNIALVMGSIVSVFVALTLRYAIMAQHKAQAALTEMKKNKTTLSLIKATLESTADGILFIDMENKSFQYNQRLLDMWKLNTLLSEDNFDHNVVNYMQKQLAYPLTFIDKIAETHANLGLECFYEMELIDNRTIECYVKPQKIDNIIVGHCWSFRDVTSAKQMQEQIRHQTTHDALTNLPNRFLLSVYIDQAINKAKANNNLFALLFIGLNNLKLVNDSLGHEAGDQLLVEFTKRIKAQLRASDVFARFGGDQFVIILPDLKSEEDCVNEIRKLMEIADQPYMIEDRVFHTDFSIGITLSPRDGDDPESLLRYADSAMYSAKLKRENKFRFYTEKMNTRLSERISLENDLREAIENESFILHYQPIVHLKTGAITGVEALIRWQHHTNGIIPPAKFIPLAESTGLINSIGDWVFKTAFNQLKSWHNEGLFPLTMAVNLSVHQLNRSNFTDKIQQLLEELKLDPVHIEIELTESVMIDNSVKIMTQLNRLSDLGILLSVDDFGTGYSSLNYLRNLPFNILKIDRSFISDIDRPENIGIVKSILSIAKHLNLSVIAEGIETVEQLQALIDSECQKGQGFYFSMPVDSEVCKKVILENRANISV